MVAIANKKAFAIERKGFFYDEMLRRFYSKIMTKSRQNR